MSDPITLFVPGHPISVNAAYKHVRPKARQDGKRARRRALTEEALLWKDTVGRACLQLRQYHLKPPLAIGYRFQGVRADVDNLLKLTADAIAEALFMNDRQFSIAHASVGPGEPGVWLTIEEVAHGDSSLQAS